MLSSPAPLQDYYRLLQDSVSAALPLSSAGVQHAEVEAQKYLETHVDPLLFSIENQHLFDAVSAGNDRVLDSVRRLDAIKQELEKIVAAARLQLNRVKDAANAEINLKDLLEYGQRVSRYSSAPYGWKPNTNDGTPVFPPIPQDMHMKRSLLFLPDPYAAGAGVGGGLGGSSSGGIDSGIGGGFDANGQGQAGSSVETDEFLQMLQQPDQMTEAATTTTDKNGDVTNDQAAVLDSDDDLLDLDL